MGISFNQIRISNFFIEHNEKKTIFFFVDEYWTDPVIRGRMKNSLVREDFNDHESLVNVVRKRGTKI